MNNFFKNRKNRFILAIFSLLLLLNFIQESYAKYISTASANNSFAIAEWAFTVNNQDVLANSNFSNVVVPVFDQNTNIKAGVLAPTSTGYFDITINSTDVEVAYDEVISLSNANNNTVTDLIFTSYKINNGTAVSLSGSSPTITVNHSVNEAVRVNTYRIFFEWFDGTGESMNNQADTVASGSGVASINVNLQFIQRAATN